jgi:hypothetical protein
MNTMLKLAYRPLGLAGGVLGGLLAGALFKRAWQLAAHEDEPPSATDEDRGWAAVVLAAALRGAVFGGVKAAVDRAGATGYARVTGVWPGQPVEEQA